MSHIDATGKLVVSNGQVCLAESLALQEILGLAPNAAARCLRVQRRDHGVASHGLLILVCLDFGQQHCGHIHDTRASLVFHADRVSR